MGCALHNPACAAADDDTDETAGNADEDGLDEELRQDVHSSGTHTHAQTDFAGALRYGYIHDVHDADAAYHQRYAGGEGQRHIGPPKWIFIMRDFFSMILTVGLSAAIRLSGRWVQVEAARREAEKSRTEAELKNLRNQLNPHFLLNTLNNIYALIAFDTDKAQTAVQELSRLLRHVLYDNQQNFVTLGKEMDFIKNYIALMRIRLSSNVTVETRFDIRPDSPTEIAPLIFISLIENAFKHGISPTEPSHIRIYFSENVHEVRCEITNSYHPKSEADKSGSGIGLEQVGKRLELTYPGRYEWKHGISEDGKEYKSVLTINY
jgi:LytS/YehU family sensor histidine kinase